LLANDTQAPYFLNIAIAVGNKPMACNQLHTGLATIPNRNGIGKGKLPIIWVGLFWQILGSHRNTDFM
jgi:hypothetical protein